MVLTVQRYEQVFGLDSFIFDSLEKRRVKTARVKIGETWLVLIEPIDEHGIPAQHLKKYGEGFFLLSFATSDIENYVDQLDTLLDIDEKDDVATGTDFQVRQGLDNWRVVDLPMNSFFGAQLQLTQEGN